jgi:hypothetical protein
VAYIKQANALANSVMFFEDSGILNRHVPSAKINHSRAGAPVHRVEWCGFQERGRMHERETNLSSKGADRKPSGCVKIARLGRVAEADAE